eukprot:1179730-Prorocentrum_minimum.AAC.3
MHRKTGEDRGPRYAHSIWVLGTMHAHIMANLCSRRNGWNDESLSCVSILLRVTTNETDEGISAVNTTIPHRYDRRAPRKNSYLAQDICQKPSVVKRVPRLCLPA